MNEKLPLILLGAGGHAKVLLSLIKAINGTLLGVCDPVLASQGIDKWRGIPIIGNDGVLRELDPKAVGLVNGLGQTIQSQARQILYERYRAQGFRFPVLIHPTAWVDSSAMLHDGVQIMAGAIVQADTAIGENCIINTGARVDHDCHLGADVHIAPGAVLCGAVQVGAGAFVGCGANVIQGIRIGSNSIVGAGTTLVRNLESNQLVLRAAPEKKVWINSKKEIRP